MALEIGKVDHSATTYTATAATEKKAEAATAEAVENATATKKANKDTYTPSFDRVEAMKAEVNNQLTLLKRMVYGQINEQGTNWGEVFKNAEVSSEVQAEAQANIAEDGYWGVEQTAGRILDFAKALSGGDPEKIEMLREAVQKGFKAAEKAWGGKLPEITNQTYDRIMEGFDEWAKGCAGGDEAATEE